MTRLFYRRASVLAVCALGFLLLGASKVPTLPMPPNTAMIFNPGTSDYSGFRIVVAPDGRAISIDGAGHSSRQLESDVVQKFFADLAAASPLGQLRSSSCSTQSAGDVTTVEVNAAIVITWKGQHSTLLRCATDPRAQKLLLDATQIQHALYVQAYRERNLITYGTQYQGAANYGSAGYLSNAGVSFEHFYTGGFSNEPLRFDGLSMEHFSNGLQTTSPFSGAPYSGSPWSSLPTTSLPSATLPYTSLPYANVFAGTPYSSSSLGASPFVSLPTSSVTTGTPYTTQTHP